MTFFSLYAVTSVTVDMGLDRQYGMCVLAGTKKHILYTVYSALP